MNAGLILTPVSIYQMTRGSVVLFVGVLSVIFLRRTSRCTLLISARHVTHTARRRCSQATSTATSGSRFSAS
jgi:hypothetical protein